MLGYVGVIKGDTRSSDFSSDVNPQHRVFWDLHASQEGGCLVCEICPMPHGNCRRPLFALQVLRVQIPEYWGFRYPKAFLFG